MFISPESPNEFKLRLAATICGILSGMSLLYYHEKLEASRAGPPAWLIYMSPVCSALIKPCCLYIFNMLVEWITNIKIWIRKSYVKKSIQIAAGRENISESHAAYLQRKQMTADRSVIEYHHEKLQNALRKPPHHPRQNHPEDSE